MERTLSPQDFVVRNTGEVLPKFQLFEAFITSTEQRLKLVLERISLQAVGEKTPSEQRLQRLIAAMQEAVSTLSDVLSTES